MNSIRYLDPETGMPQIEALRRDVRAAYAADRVRQREDKIRQIVLTIALAGVLTAFWGLVFWLVDRT